jgi:hypothetical protein
MMSGTSFLAPPCRRFQSAHLCQLLLGLKRTLNISNADKGLSLCDDCSAPSRSASISNQPTPLCEKLLTVAVLRRSLAAIAYVFPPFLPQSDILNTLAGNQAELEALAINPSTRFSSMFEAVNVTAHGKCPEGFYPANTPFSSFKQKVKGKSVYVECLKIKVSVSYMPYGMYDNF